jgi:hypothetical protein
MECYDAVIADFFKSGTVVGLNTDCLATMTPPAFRTE